MKITSEAEMKRLGAKIGAILRGGEIFELVGDVGAGKTTFTKGLAQGLGVDDDVQSPSFTISRVYPAHDGLTFNHYDFYRLADAGIMQMELAEALEDSRAVTAIEWSDSVAHVLPEQRIVVRFAYLAESDARDVTFEIPDELQHVKEATQ